MLSERRHSILSLVAQAYIASARPVPSAYVAEQLSVSSATVRNEFSALEEHGMLQQQHVSSGRIPSLRGLSYYASNFIPPGSLPRRQLHFISSRISEAHGADLLQDIARLAADLSGYAVVVRFSATGELRVLQVHLSVLSEERLLAVVILENGLVRQHVVELSPMPESAVIGEAEISLRQLTVPLQQLGSELYRLAHQRDGDLRRLLLALAAGAEGLYPVQLFSHGIGNLLTEPEAQDPEFVRLALQAVETPDGGAEDAPDLDLVLAESTARVRAALRIGRSRAELNLIGPVRMRYPETLRIASGIQTALGAPEARSIN